MNLRNCDANKTKGTMALQHRQGQLWVRRHQETSMQRLGPLTRVLADKQQAIWGACLRCRPLEDAR
jgi:hypothetical protein